jgi:hypothetical protein
MFPRGFFTPSYFPASYFAETGGLPNYNTGKGFRGAGKNYLPYLLMADKQRWDAEKIAIRRRLASARAINAANYVIDRMYQTALVESSNRTIVMMSAI